MEYDLAIIGAGAAGFAAAIAAREQGRSVLMVERGTIGGTCVNTGCVPSKALLATAHTRGVAVEQRFAGIATSVGAVDMAALSNAKNALVQTMRAEKYENLAAEYGWKIVSGQAHLASGPVLELTEQNGLTRTIEAEHHLIATGSTPWIPPIPGLAEAGYLTSTTAMELTQLPDSMIVLGGNAVGLEQAQLFANLGVSVTIVEVAGRLAPFEEPELSAALEEVLVAAGITVHTATTVTSVRHDQSGYKLAATHDGSPLTVQAGQLLVATGRRPTTQGLNVDTVGVKTGARGEIVVDEHLRTDNPRIWAAGDVTGYPQFVYVAAAQGTLAANNAGNDAGRSLDFRNLPRVIFTNPSVASVGLTDAQANEQDIACQCRVLPLKHVPRAIVNRDTRGVIKLVAERGTGRLLGAHAVAENAGEIITTAVYALNNAMTIPQLANIWTPYLTMSEGLKLAAQAFTRDISKLSCCAA